MPSHRLHTKWAFKIIGRSLRDVDLIVDKIEIHDYPCRGEFYQYKALQLSYILFEMFGCDAVKAMYLHCVMDLIDVFLKQKNVELRDKGYFKIDGMICYARSRLADDEWLWTCVFDDNPYLGITLTQEHLEGKIIEIIKEKVRRLLNDYLEAVKKAAKLVENEEELGLPEELLKDIITVASNKAFIECAHSSLIELKSKMDNEILFKEMINDIANEAITRVHSVEHRRISARRYLR